MSKKVTRGYLIRQFILDHVDKNSQTIVQLTAKKFAISRQAVNKHIKLLVEQGSIRVTGRTKGISYRINQKHKGTWRFDLSKEGLNENDVWIDKLKPMLQDLPQNIYDIWFYGFGEMFNNVLDHSEGTQVVVQLTREELFTHITIKDNGVGIFKKIQKALNLSEESHAILELSKGKFTTDPKNHSGQGIFFTSRIFEEFLIISGEVFFAHEREDNEEDWIIKAQRSTQGTKVEMKIANQSEASLKNLFDQFSDVEDYAFSKTIVPVKLAQQGGDQLVSRSQAKRLLLRFDRFKTIVLDFEGVDFIGQAFADEVFRVFKNNYPQITLIEINSNSDIKKMISRARAN